MVRKKCRAHPAFRSLAGVLSGSGQGLPYDTVHTAKHTCTSET